MINPKELRIKNLVIHKGSFKNIGQIGIGHVTLNQKNEDIDNLFVYKYSDINPIPLTHEILEKAGFVYDETNEEYTIGGIDFDANDQDIEKTFILWSDNKEDFECYFSDIPIKSLHQLQNLYFALTGEELEIKL